MAAATAATGGATVRMMRRWPTAALVALTVVLAFESLRVLFPHLYGLRERDGLMAVLIAFLAVALAPFLASLLGRVLRPHRAAAVCAALLVAWRLVVQFLDPVALATAIAGAIVALITLTLVLSAPLPGGGPARTLGLFAGLALDVMLLAGSQVMKPAWQPGPAAGVVGAVLAAALLAAAVLVFRGGAAEEGGSPPFSGGVAVGVVAALEFLFLANSAFLAAAGRCNLGVAVAVVAAGAVAALGIAVVPWRLGRPATAVGAVLLAAAGFFLPAATGALALALLPAAQLGAGSVVGRALASGSRGPSRAGLGLAVGWLVGLVGILLYQLHYDSPLGVDNRYVTALLGLVAVVAVIGRRAAAPRPGRAHLAWACAGLLIAGAVVAVVVGGITAPFDGTAEAADGSFLVVQWNVHQAIGEDGRLNPETVAAELDDLNREAGGRIVVVLNEVGRGWPLSGQIDLATWMSSRLGMRMVWGAASGPGFGNVILTRFAVTDSEVVTLTHWDDYQGRSLVEAAVDLGGGRAITVLGTHLQHRNTAEAHAARMTEIGEVLEHWGGAAATVLAGDLNPKQGDPPEYPPRVPREFEEIAALLAAGFTTAQNLETCDPPTSNDNCSDYILVGPGLSQASFEVGENFGDHRMLVARVTAR